MKNPTEKWDEWIKNGSRSWFERATIYDFTHVFIDMDDDIAFEKIMNWLTQEGAHHITFIKPFQISAEHGSYFGDNKGNYLFRNSKKKVFFQIEQMDIKTVVTLWIEINSRSFGSLKEDILRSWKALSEEIWDHVEGKNLHESNDKIANLSVELRGSQKKRATLMMWVGVIMLIIGSLMLIAVIMIEPSSTSPLSILWFCPVFIAIGMIVVLFGMIERYRFNDLVKDR